MQCFEMTLQGEEKMPYDEVNVSDEHAIQAPLGGDEQVGDAQRERQSRTTSLAQDDALKKPKGRLKHRKIMNHFFNGHRSLPDRPRAPRS
jgi:hypothetical protein